MSDPTTPKSSAGAPAPKALWIGAGLLGTLIVVLLAAVLYKLSVPPAPPSAPAAATSAPAPGKPESAVSVTGAGPGSQAPAQFPRLQASAPQRPAARHKPEPRPAARAQAGDTQSMQPQTFAPQAMPQTAPAPAAPSCRDCGTVTAVSAEQQAGQANGLGAVVGGVVGGLLGNQVGGGNGRTAATVIGAVGGGLAGNEVQKRINAHTIYHVQVRMDDGQVREFTEATAPAVGQRVQVGTDGGLHAM